MMNNFARMKIQKPPPQLTTKTLARLGNQSKMQLRAWRCTKDRHEQIALGRETSGWKITKKWLEEVETKIGEANTKPLAGMTELRRLVDGPGRQKRTLNISRTMTTRPVRLQS